VRNGGGTSSCPLPHPPITFSHTRTVRVASRLSTARWMKKLGRACNDTLIDPSNWVPSFYQSSEKGIHVEKSAFGSLDLGFDAVRLRLVGDHLGCKSQRLLCLSNLLFLCLSNVLGL
jgi:hypothetical protein